MTLRGHVPDCRRPFSGLFINIQVYIIDLAEFKACNSKIALLIRVYFFLVTHLVNFTEIWPLWPWADMFHTAADPFDEWFSIIRYISLYLPIFKPVTAQVFCQLGFAFSHWQISSIFLIFDLCDLAQTCYTLLSTLLKNGFQLLGIYHYTCQVSSL